MTKVISSKSLRKANELSMRGDHRHVSLDRNNAQVSCRTVFGTQTITVSRESISKAGRGK